MSKGVEPLVVEGGVVGTGVVSTDAEVILGGLDVTTSGVVGASVVGLASEVVGMVGTTVVGGSVGLEETPVVAEPVAGSVVTTCVVVAPVVMVDDTFASGRAVGGTVVPENSGIKEVVKGVVINSENCIVVGSAVLAAVATGISNVEGAAVEASDVGKRDKDSDTTAVLPLDMTKEAVGTMTGELGDTNSSIGVTGSEEYAVEESVGDAEVIGVALSTVGKTGRLGVSKGDPVSRTLGATVDTGVGDRVAESVCSTVGIAPDKAVPEEILSTNDAEFIWVGATISPTDMVEVKSNESMIEDVIVTVCPADNDGVAETSGDMTVENWFPSVRDGMIV